MDPGLSDTEDAKFFCDSDYTGLDRKKKNQILNQTSFKKAFSDCWLGFLGLKMNQATYISILEILHQTLIPKMTSPVALMDFLVDAYDSGFNNNAN